MENRNTMGVGVLMKRHLILSLLLFLSACTGITVPSHPWQAGFTPSASPAIRSPTLPYQTGTLLTLQPSLSSTGTPITSPEPSPTPTLDPTLGLSLQLSGCNTSLDVANGMGEVTNAYVLLQNTTQSDLSNVCATLSASDEDRPHPDKSACVALLPHNFRVTLKLTVDTGFQEDTSISVSVSSLQGLTAVLDAPSCLDIAVPGWIPGEIGIVEPIP
jgi:hypothetical protein